MMSMMMSSEQGVTVVPENAPGSQQQGKSMNGLSFSKMLERFYLNQCPPDPTDPNAIPPANLQDRRQN